MTKPDAGSTSDDEAPLCAVCKKAKRKYCCPRCGIMTCRLECCLRHKRETQCSGKRDAGTFVSMSSMTLGDLRKDASFLEAAARLHESTKRARRDDWSPRLDGHGRRSPMGRLEAACERRRIRLLVMPQGMSKRRTNTTRYDHQSDTIFWRVEWRFEESSLHDDGAHERTPLAHLAAGAAKASSALTTWFDGSLRYFIQRLPGRANSPVFDALDPNVGLDVSLAGKCVIEYPTVHVVRLAQAAAYHVAAAPVSLLDDA